MAGHKRTGADQKNCISQEQQHRQIDVGGRWGVIQDDAEGVKWFRKAADKGDASAQYNLGIMYINGQGVRQDYAEALKWHLKAAEQGYADAQYEIGRRYFAGQGLAKDYSEAVRWARKAAEQGHAMAQLVLSSYYFQGLGDYVESYKWSILAAAKGETNALKARDLLAKLKMTREQIAEGQRLASAFIVKKSSESSSQGITNLP